MPKPKPRTDFDWHIYADATFAGLSVLIPVIGIDWLFEQFFRRRIPAAVAKQRGKIIPPDVITALRKGQHPGCVKGCILLPVLIVFWVIKRLSKKILYFLTVKDSAERTSYYWQQAFLIDYTLQAGYLNTIESAQMAHQAFELVVQTDSTASFYQLSWQVATSVKHILRTLNQVRRGTENEVISKTKAEMKQGWTEFENDLLRLAEQFEEAYQKIRAGQTPPHHNNTHREVTNE